jgi:hypothetical protein
MAFLDRGAEARSSDTEEQRKDDNTATGRLFLYIAAQDRQYILRSKAHHRSMCDSRMIDGHGWPFWIAVTPTNTRPRPNYEWDGSYTAKL